MFTLPLLLLTSTVVHFPAPRDPGPDDKGRGFFGVQLVDDGGVSITQVVAGSPADKAGIRVNDQILIIDSQKVPSVNEAREVIGRLRPGRTTVIEVKRGEKTMTIKVMVGIRPDGLP
jgi:S1-C subfamily serine protease